MLRITKINDRKLISPRESVINLQEDKRFCVKVAFDQDFDGPIELILVEEIDAGGSTE